MFEAILPRSSEPAVRYDLGFSQTWSILEIRGGSMSSINGDRARANKKTTKRRLRRSQIQTLRAVAIPERSGEVRSGPIDAPKSDT
jgi:hypothetical protein